jgi:hypothetical protein
MRPECSHAAFHHNNPACTKALEVTRALTGWKDPGFYYSQLLYKPPGHPHATPWASGRGIRSHAFCGARHTTAPFHADILGSFGRCGRRQRLHALLSAGPRWRDIAPSSGGWRLRGRRTHACSRTRRVDGHQPGRLLSDPRGRRYRARCFDLALHTREQIESSAPRIHRLHRGIRLLAKLTFPIASDHRAVKSAPWARELVALAKKPFSEIGGLTPAADQQCK